MEDFFKKWLLDPTMGKLIASVFGVILILFCIRFINRYVSRFVEDSKQYRLRKIINFIGYIVCIALLGVIFSDRLSKLTVAFGVAGAGIAFALQEVIASIAGWIAISLSHFFTTGDRILLGGIKGDVIDIGLLRTTLMECGGWVNGDLYNGRIVRISNSFVFKEPVFNYSADFPFLWDEILIPVKHGSDLKLARDIIKNIVHEVVGDYSIDAAKSWKEIVKKFKIEPAKVEPTVTLSFNENWVEFTIRYVVDYKERRMKKDKIFTQILEEFIKTQNVVSIASTAIDISLVKTTGFDVNINKNL